MRWSAGQRSFSQELELGIPGIFRLPEKEFSGFIGLRPLNVTASLALSSHVSDPREIFVDFEASLPLDKDLYLSFLSSRLSRTRMCDPAHFSDLSWSRPVFLSNQVIVF